MKLSRKFLILALLLNTLLLLAILSLAPKRSPIRPASAARFWYALTEVHPGTPIPRLNTDFVVPGGDAITFFDRDRFIFSGQYPFHVNPDYRYETTTLAEATRDFPRIEPELLRRIPLNEPYDHAAKGYSRWKSIGPDNGGIPGLVDCIYEARLEKIRQTSAPQIPSQNIPHFKQGLAHVASAAKLYWATITFEILYLSALLWFLFLPYIRRRPLTRKLLHVAAFPFLLFLPTWLGYYNSASPSAPLGGILYPYICCPNPALFNNPEWELRLLSSLPPFFHVIAQGRSLTYADYFTTKGPVPVQWGPINTAILSAILLTLALTPRLLSHLHQKYQSRRRPRGFPIEPTTPTSEKENSPTP